MSLEQRPHGTAHIGDSTTAATGSLGWQSRLLPRWSVAVMLLAPSLAMALWAGLSAGGVAALLALVVTLGVVLAATSPTAGILFLLAIAPFDQLVHDQLLRRFDWYPLAFHVLDPISVALCAGYAWRLLRGRGWRGWRWYDWAAAAFLSVTVLAAARGMLTGQGAALREARFIPLLAAYFPAREVLGTENARRRLGRWVVLLTSTLAGAVLVLAFLLRYEHGRAGYYFFLPRLCYVADDRPLLLLTALAWGYLWYAYSRRQRLLMPLLSLAATGGIMAIDGTRTIWVGVAVVWAGMLALLGITRAQWRAWLCVGVAGTATFAVGLLALETANQARPRLLPYRCKVRGIGDPVAKAEAEVIASRRRQRLAWSRRQQLWAAQNGAEEPVTDGEKAVVEVPRDPVKLERAMQAAQAATYATGNRLLCARRTRKTLLALGFERPSDSPLRPDEELPEAVAGSPEGATGPLVPSAKTLAINMRILRADTARSSDFSPANRLLEVKAVLGATGAVTALTGHGVGAPLVQELILPDGKKARAGVELFHNSYGFFLYTTGLPGLLLCLVWLGGLLVAGVLHARRTLTGSVPWFWTGNLVFFAATLATATVIASLNYASSAGLVGVSAALVASALGRDRGRGEWSRLRAWRKVEEFAGSRG